MKSNIFFRVYVLKFLIGILLLAGCSGSPVHTSSLSPSKLTTIDDYTLCKAYTPREAYYPSYSVIAEVERRGINCPSIYQYRSLTPTINALQAIHNSSMGQSSGISSIFKRDYTSGLNRICIYDQGGMDKVITIEVTKICPLSL